MPENILTLTIDSPLGKLRIGGTKEGVRSIGFLEDEEALVEQQVEGNAVLRSAAEQLQEYFAGSRKTFNDLPLAIVGTDFQQRVWDSISQIPWGETVTYGQVAADIGDTNAARAVGTAIGRNPLCIIIPCHRIVAAGEDGGGYAWGIWRKEWLLKHEDKNS